jgi:tight adherence protein B
MSPIIIIIAAFIGVAALVFAVATMFRADRDEEIEKRLSFLTGSGTAKDKSETAQLNELLSAFRNEDGSPFDRFIGKYFKLTLLFEQADVSLSMTNFAIVTGILAILGTLLPALIGFSVALSPIFAFGFAVLPIFWLLFRRKRRLRKFAAQLPEGLELISRALRAGHSLASGFSLVAEEMSDPISTEFGRTYEEQNLGKPLDEALDDLTKRIPNLDLKFFATAVVLQRQTGGDLAEILDKIGYLIRERFKIWGQVQALTGEGRLSGIVLLALPPALFVVVYRMNPDYLMLLFTDEMGKKMLVVGIVMQILGALLIRKIVNIRV